jgi:hypothetical protein
MSGTIGYLPIENMFGEPRPYLFRKILNKTLDQLRMAESLESKALKAYACMKLKANKRRNNLKTGTTKWKLQINDKMLVRCQPTSDAAQGVTGKFQHLFEGPPLISKIIPP